MAKTTKDEGGGTRVFLRLKAVKAKTGLAESTVFYLMKKGQFPKSFKLGLRAAAWDEAEIEAWMESRMAKRDQAAA